MRQAKEAHDAAQAKGPDPDYVPKDEDEPIEELPDGAVLVSSPNAYMEMAGVVWSRLPKPTLWRQDWYGWVGTQYEKNEHDQFETLVRPILETMVVMWKKKLVPLNPSIATVANVLRAMQALPGAAVRQESDRHPPFRRGGPELDMADHVVFRNGILDTRKNILMPPDPEIFLLQCIEAEWSEDAKCPQWEAFLNQQWGNDRMSQALLQEWFGYCLSSGFEHHKMLFLKGPRRSGKGTILRVLRALLGDSYVDIDVNDIGGEFGMEPMINRTVVGDGDVRWGNDNSARALARLLKLAGGDGVPANRKNKTSVTVSDIKVLLFGNEWPAVIDRTGALAGRLLLLEHTKSFFGGEDVDLTAKLVGELPGIAAWAVEGLKRLRRARRFTETTYQVERQVEIQEIGNPLLRFFREELVIAAEGWVSSADLRKAYEASARASGRGVLSEENFGKELRTQAKEHGVTLERAKRRIGGRLVWGYSGVALVDDGAVVAITDRQIVRAWLDDPKAVARDVWGHQVINDIDTAAGFTLSDVLEHVLKVPRERHPQHEHRAIRVLEHLGYQPDEETGRYAFRRLRVVQPPAPPAQPPLWVYGETPQEDTGE